MRHLTALLLAGGLGAAAVAGGLYAGRASAPATETIRTVDISRILQDFEPMAKEYEALRLKYQPQGDRLRKFSDDIKSEKGQLAQLDRASEEFNTRNFQVQLREKTLEQELEFWTTAQRRESEVLLDRSVRRVHAACDVYGARSGVSAVLMRPGPLPDSAGDPRNSLRDLEGRWVVWANPEHDVTDAVLAILREQG
jgi:Skp family chaperone for outer membrane proteins